MKAQAKQLWIALLLMVCSCTVSVRASPSSDTAGAAVAQCSKREQCPAVQNFVDVRCVNGSCRYVCSAGFKAFGRVCVSVNITCSKGQQPHVAGRRCVVCPKNTFKSTVGNMPCTACPNGTFTAGTTPDSYDSVAKCVAGGLDSKDNVQPPRLRQFRQQLAAAQLYMSSSNKSGSSSDGRSRDRGKKFSHRQPAAGPWQGMKQSNGSSNTAARLTEAVASIAGSPQVVTPYQKLLGMPPRKPRVQDQRLCATCVNAAFVSAAEASVAAAAGISTQHVEFSPVYAYYCDPPMARSCSSGWTFQDALRRLSAAAWDFLPAASCTKGHDFGAIRGSSPGQLGSACDDVSNTCPTSDLLLDCNYKNLTDFWDIQRAIRVHGAVVTRITVHPLLVEFFRANPRGVYDETSSNPSNTSSGIPHAVVLVGYNNTGQFWWAQNSYGTAFADQGVFKISYGIGLVANPHETFAILCRLPPSHPVNPARKWPLQVVSGSSTSVPPCYRYIARRGDYLAGIAEHFGTNIVRLLQDNVQVFAITKRGKSDLTTPLVDKQLLVCGITNVQDTASLECGAGEYQSGLGNCEVCPHDTFKEGPGPGPCQACPPGTTTTGCATIDHNDAADCTPVTSQLLCEQFIGRYNKSGSYNVTIRCKQYQVYCDMETDDGGWTLILSYNVGAYSNARDVFPRDLDDGFPILSNNTLGVDESLSISRGGTWGHMSPRALSFVPNSAEILGLFEVAKPSDGLEVLRSHYKSTEEDSLGYIMKGAGSLNINIMRHSHTPMLDQNGFIPLDGLGSFVATDLWALARAGVPIRHAVYIRGQSAQPPVCEPGQYQAGWTCHICPDHTYKAVHGPGPCIPCPRGKIATAGILAQRTATNHDNISDCKTAMPDNQWSVQRADGSAWAWDFYWTTRAQAARAEDVCRLQGGHLVTLDSESTSQMLFDKVTSDNTGRPPFPFVHALTIMWIGLYSNTTNTQRSGPWGWYSGAEYPSNYTAWAEYQPDNYFRGQGFNVAMLLDNNKMWDDYYHWFFQEFVCERKIVG